MPPADSQGAQFYGKAPSPASRIYSSKKARPDKPLRPAAVALRAGDC